ncbi:MAG: hypothetical protein ABSF80_02250 [Chitinispirillaceae bacterium]|jgi:hypothetical protein
MKCLRCGYQATEHHLRYSCPLCGFTTVTDALGSAPASGETAPWETFSADRAPLKAIVISFYNSLFKPERFFSVLGTTASTVPAFIYGLVTGSAGVCAGLLWNSFLPLSFSSAISGADVINDYHDALSPLSIIATPVLLVAQLLLVAVVVHAMLWITKSKKKTFSVTFKTICYAEGAALFQIIPVAGGFLAFAGWLYLVISGIHAAQGISVKRVCVVLLAPPLVLAAITTAIFILGIIVFVSLGGSQTDLLSLFRHR